MAFIKFTIIILILFTTTIGQIKCQAVTRADIQDLQRQINNCLATAQAANNLANYNFESIEEIVLLQEKRHNDTIDRFNSIYNDISYLLDQSSAARQRLSALEGYVGEIYGRLEVAEIAIEKLLKNNEIWLNNFKVIKNILTTGLKFKGTINYGAAVAVTFVRRANTRPNFAAAADSSSSNSNNNGASSTGAGTGVASRTPYVTDRIGKNRQKPQRINTTKNKQTKPARVVPIRTTG